MKKTILLLTTFLLFGNVGLNAQANKAVLLGSIKCGDNLEKCIVNGWIQGGINADDWELVDSNISSYFPESNVKFDSKNIVKEINLSCPLYDEGKAKNDPKGALNYMLQYFCIYY